MEREYTIGGVLVLITIFVIALIVYFTVPGFNEAIKDIADEVFGITKGKEAELEARAKEKISTDLLEDLYKCIMTVHEQIDEKKDGYSCSCYLESRDLPEEYIIALPIEDEKTGERSLELISGYTRTKKVLEDVNLRKLGKDIKDISLQPDTPIDFEKFPENIPEVHGLYKKGKAYVILTTKKLSSNDPIAKALKKMKDCGSGEVIVEKKSIDLFKSFVGRFKACKEIEKKEIGKPCACSSVDFDTLKNLLGYKITAVTDGKNTKFTLHDSKLKKITGSIEVKDVTIGSTPFAKWDKAELLEGERYMILIRDKAGKHISMYTSLDMKATDIPSCTLDIFQEKCRDIDDEYEVIERIKTKEDTRTSKTYKQIIEESVNDIEKILDTPKKVDKTKVGKFLSSEENLENLKLLGAAVMAAESSAKPDALSKTGCKGLMQFCGPAAHEERLCYGKKKEYCVYDDFRNVPSEAIPKGIKHFLRKASDFDVYTYQEAFGLAAYNGGQEPIKNAIRETGKSNPSWQEVKDKLTRELLKESSSLYAKWYKEDKKKVDAKIKEIKCYPYIVDHYKREFAARELFD